MDDFGPKRPASDDAVKGKRGRPKKKPNYDKAETISDLLKKAVELYDEPYDDRKERSKGAPSLSAVAREMNTTTIRVKKMLVTTSFYSTAISRKVQELLQNGADIQEIMSQTGLKDASVYSYISSSSSSTSAKSEAAEALPARRSPSLTFWMLPRPAATPLFPLALNAKKLMDTLQ